MTNDEKLMQQALEALEWHTEMTRPLETTDRAITALRERLARDDLNKLAEIDQEIGLWPEPARQEQEPVAHSIVAGALFDFMGWLTTRPERLVLSSTDDAAPAADAIKEFAQMRSLSISDAQVQEWQEHLAPQQPAQQPLTYIQIERLYFKHCKYQEESMEVSGIHDFARAIEAAHGIGGKQ